MEIIKTEPGEHLLMRPQISPSPSSPPLKGGAVLLPSPLEGEGLDFGLL